MNKIISASLVFLFVSATADQQHETPRFKKYFTIVMENTDFKVAMETPFLKELSSKGRLLTNMHGMVHPSQPNYIDMIAGTNFGKLTDDNVDLTGPILPDLLESKGLTWKSYQENYPGKCNATYGTADKLYMRKHNPFMSFDSIRENPQRCANIVDEKEFLNDVAKESMPNFIFYTPNQIHDGHGVPPYSKSEHERIMEGAVWLSTFLPNLLSNPLFKDTLFVITFDESDVTGDTESKTEGSDKAGSLIGKENLIYTVLLGAGVQVGSVDNTRYDHHSGIALLEREWNLGSLGSGDVVATPFKLSDDDLLFNPPSSSDSMAGYSTLYAEASSFVTKTASPCPTTAYPYPKSTQALPSMTYPSIYQSSAITSTAASMMFLAFAFFML